MAFDISLGRPRKVSLAFLAQMTRIFPPSYSRLDLGTLASYCDPQIQRSVRYRRPFP